MNMQKTPLFYMLIAAIGIMPAVSEAALNYVRAGATGANNGSDWNNAYATLPSSLVRGNTYYLADGSYSGYTFDDANNGTSVITIKKATASDHGSDTGWASTYGDGQAVFFNWYVYTDYYVFDGQVRNADWRTGGVNQYGITTGNTRLDNGSGTGGDNLTFRYIDIHGGGRDTGDGDDVIYGLTGNSNITFQYCALRDSDRTIFLMRGNWQNLVVDHSYLARNTSTPAIHGELLSMTDSNGVTFSNNAIEDIEGTAVFAGLNDGIASNWKIFGNSFLHTAAYIADTGRQSNHNDGIAGIVFCANDSSNNNTCNNFLVYNNTVVNIQGTWSGVTIQQGTGNSTQNNIWYNSVRTGSTAGTAGGNLYINTIADGDTSASKAVCTSNCSIFVNPANRDFHLNTATATGTALTAPYNTDPDSITRGSDGTWDRGAFEFGGTQSATMLPPTLRTITQ
ncbi:hypothetical protein MGMO_57c00360 [Methyloglobulus morosus KoM1]|uniref:Right handed beta helix domain-containing protein n=1 Tax=Methyloglobulus morosus KoM1 TaxID=1116472 RepID=V5DYR5_9GAMM|nr:hypothetical protein [Methyloglobulus morosus]ESS72456.1 hypothetical protein MGMO_57c00360 [Methyloglobulus morosus KoM1]